MGSFVKSNRLSPVFLRNHVHVRLQNDPLAGLHARRSRFAQDHVPGIVDRTGDAVRPRFGDQIRPNRLLVPRRTRHTSDLGEFFPHLAGESPSRFVFIKTRFI